MLLFLVALLSIAAILLCLFVGQNLMIPIIIAAIFVAVWRSRSNKTDAKKNTARLRATRAKSARSTFSDVQDRFNRVTAEWVANDSRIVPGDHSGFFTRYESAKESIAAAEDALSGEDTSTYEGITRVEDRVSHAKEEMNRLENEWSHMAFLNPAAL